MCYCPAEEVGFQKAAPASLRMNVTVFRGLGESPLFPAIAGCIYVWEQEVAAGVWGTPLFGMVDVQEKL